MKKGIKKGKKEDDFSFSRIANQKERKLEQKRKKRKLQYQKLIFIIAIILLVILLIWLLFQVKLRNIVIQGNEFLSDQYIIDAASLKDYPSTFQNPTFQIKKHLEQNDYIQSVKVKKDDFFRRVIITVEENKPLFFYAPTNKVVLEDGTQVDGNYAIPTVINQIPDDVYERFLKKMAGVPNDVLIRMSEIRYYPNDVDELRFYITMNDGNCVVATIPKFERIYDYLKYVEQFNDKRGILYMDGAIYLEEKN